MQRKIIINNLIECWVKANCGLPASSIAISMVSRFKANSQTFFFNTMKYGWFWTEFIFNYLVNLVCDISIIFAATHCIYSIYTENGNNCIYRRIWRPVAYWWLHICFLRLVTCSTTVKYARARVCVRVCCMNSERS